MWGYNCNKTKLLWIDANITSIKKKRKKKKVQKIKKHELNAIVYAKET
jgi:hypothetical protein